MKNYLANSPRLRSYLFQHGLPILFFFLLTIAFTWPAVRDFSSQYIGQNSDDTRHNLWLLWHVKEAVLGRQPLYDVSLLYYPAGISMHLHGIGPLVGILSLPFWFLGPAAAYNGAVLVAFTLNGYALYLLARRVKLSNTAALFSGVLYMAGPMHLGGLYAHFEKVFTALLPLALLAVVLALDQKRSRWWTVVPAVVFLLTLLTNGLHFILAALSAVFLVLAVFWRSDSAERPELVRRVLITGASTLLLAGPLLLAIIRAGSQPGIPVDYNHASVDFQPDLLQFLTPPPFSLLFGRVAQRFQEAFDIIVQIERFIYLSWTGLALSLIAIIKRRRRVWPWLLLAAGWTILALGPALQILGRSSFTEYNLPIILPYAFFTMLPGLDFLRTPGRLMLMGFVAFSIAAGIGSQYLLDKWPRRQWAIFVVLSLFVFLEIWPQPWPTQPLQPAPPFYQTLGAETAEFGVLDLPINPPGALSHVNYSARYQLDQMTHRKGIALGYVSRSYDTHPLFPCFIPELRPPDPDIRINGRPANCYANILHDLAYYNYRYVVWHKPQPGDNYPANPAEVEASSVYLLDLLENQTPVADDEMTTVYEVPPLTAAGQISPTIALLHNWYDREGDYRWANSPASLTIFTPQPQEVRLVITPTHIYEPRPGQSLGEQGTLTVAVDGVPLTEAQIKTGVPFSVPMFLEAGNHTISLSLAAGSFRPVDTGDSADVRRLSFSVQSINMVLGN